MGADDHSQETTVVLSQGDVSETFNRQLRLYSQTQKSAQNLLRIIVALTGGTIALSSIILSNPRIVPSPNSNYEMIATQYGPSVSVIDVKLASFFIFLIIVFSTLIVLFLFIATVWNTLASLGVPKLMPSAGENPDNVVVLPNGQTTDRMAREIHANYVRYNNNFISIATENLNSAYKALLSSVGLLALTTLVYMFWLLGEYRGVAFVFVAISAVLVASYGITLLLRFMGDNQVQLEKTDKLDSFATRMGKYSQKILVAFFVVTLLVIGIGLTRLVGFGIQ